VVTLTGGYKLQVFEIHVLVKTLGAKKDEVRQTFRMLHNKELSEFYRSPDIVGILKCTRL
jgi:hypothetical protein